MKVHRTDPLFWRNFSAERTSKTSKFKPCLYMFANLSIPRNTSNRDAVERIAESCHIPIESLSDDLNKPVFLRGRPIFGYVGEQLGEIADDYDNMQWWLSDKGLNMATIVDPPHPLEHRQYLDTPNKGSKNRRGRPGKFSSARLERARKMKIAGKTNNEVAKILYIKSPTYAERRSVTTILKHHFGRNYLHASARTVK